MKKLLMAVMLLSVAVGSAQAKWWIFGQSQDDLMVRYLYLNNVSFDEVDQNCVLFKETLPNGMINIKGKATAGKSAIGAVSVSLDKGASWQKTKLSKDGSFEYSFAPEQGKGYDIQVKIIDTRGKSNDVALTSRHVSISAQDPRAAVTETLNTMIDAYAQENLNQFMSYVSENFTADKSVLERAVKNDFTAFDRLHITYTINNITKDAHGNVSVSITFSRQVTSSRSGQTLQDSSMTEFTFRPEGNGLKIYSMKMPLIFGLSDASQVATGQSAVSGAATIVVDPNTGAVTTGSSCNGSGSCTGTGSTGTGSTTAADPGSAESMTYDNVIAWTFETFKFSSGAKGTLAWANKDSAAAVAGSGDFAVYGDNHHLTTASGVTYVDMGVTSLSQITTIPSSITGTAVGTQGALAIGHCYIFKLPGGKCGALQVLGYSATLPSTMSFMYKYTTGAQFD